MPKPVIYLVDTPQMAAYFEERLKRDLGDQVEIVVGYDASDLWLLFKTRGCPDAVILQQRIVYGDEILRVNPDINFDDEDDEHAGSRILSYLHEHSFPVDLNQTYVVLFDGQVASRPGRIDRSLAFLRRQGLLSMEYRKPFDSIDLIGRLCKRFGFNDPYEFLREWAPEDKMRPEDAAE